MLRTDESKFRFRSTCIKAWTSTQRSPRSRRVTEIPIAQFGKPQRPVADPSIRKAKHEHGCGYVWYYSSRTHRAVMGLVHALLSCDIVLPG